MEATKVLKRNIVYRVRNITNKNILFGDKHTFELNELAHVIWDNLDGKKTVEDIVNIILEKYDAPKEIVMQDVHKFIDKMIDRQAILEVE